MRLLDSNIIIYAAQPDYEWMRMWLESEPFVVSQISKVEVLGYHLLTEEECRDLNGFLSISTIVALSESAINGAIILRQQRKLGLADALIAATAVAGGFKLVTRNVEDFRWIDGLSLVNPFDSQ